MKNLIRKILKEELLKEEADFNQIYRDLHKKMLYGVCMKYANNNISLAEDYCQDGWVKIYNNFDKFGGMNLSGWVYTVIKHNILDELRKKKLEYIDDPDSHFRRHIDSDYEEEPEEDERLDDIRAVVSNLSPQYKDVFNLYSQGYKHREIAKLLNISVGTSKSNLFKAKANINKYLANKPPVEGL